DLRAADGLDRPAGHPGRARLAKCRGTNDFAGAVTELRHRQVAVGGSSLHVVEGGEPGAPVVLFLHGWPQSWRTWQPIMELAASTAHVVAIDLPGVGLSTGDATDGSKRAIACVVHGLIDELGLQDVTLVGQDVGAVVTFHYLR